MYQKMSLYSATDFLKHFSFDMTKHSFRLFRWYLPKLKGKQMGVFPPYVKVYCYYRFSQSFSNFFHSFSFKEQFNFVLKNVLEHAKVDFNFKLVSSNFNIVSLYFVIISLIFVTVIILFVLPCRWVVNHKSNFVLCHSFSHVCHPISSALHWPIYTSLLAIEFVLVIVYKPLFRIY